MHKTQKKSYLFTATSIFILSFILLISTNSSTKVSAAEKKTKIETVSQTIGIEDHGDALSDTYLDLEQYKYGDYTFKSSNTKIVTVDKKRGYYTGHVVGSATISIYKLKNKKSTKVAEVKVKVARAILNYKECQIAAGNKYPGSAILYDNPRASYTLKSSDSNVVTGTNYIDLFGENAGNATVTVYEHYKVKTTKLGTIKVKVVSSKIAEENMKVSLGDKEADPYDIEIVDINPDAIYTYTVDNSKIVKIDQEQCGFYPKQFGKTKIHVYETYRDKKRKVGTMTVEVVRAALLSPEKVCQLYMYEGSLFDDIVKIEYRTPKASYYCKSADNDIVSVDGEYISHDKEGQTTLTIYEKYKGVERVLGTVNVTVSVRDTTYTGIEFIEWAVSDLSILYLDTNYIDTDDYNYMIYLPDTVETINEYAQKPDIIFTSSNEAVLKIIDNERILPVGLGKAEIIATDGDYTIKLPVTVKKTNPN